MTKSETVLSVAVIGAGYFAGFHVDAWLRNPDARLEAVADLDVEKARALLEAKGANGVDAVDSLPSLDARFDIIDIAAPPATHLSLIRQALPLANRAIICQKPFCNSLEDAREATRLAEEAGKLLIVHENFRFQPWYRVMRAELDAGRIGEPFQITFRLRPGDGQGADAYLSRQPYFQQMERFLIHETAIHWIDTFRYLMGEPKDVFADIRKLNPVIAGEDAGYFLYRYDDGRRAMFDGNRLADHAADNPRLTMGECLAEGSEGAIMLDGFGVLRFRQRGAVEWQQIECDYDRRNFGGDCVYHLQRHVTDHLLRGRQIENTAGDYLRNMEIEEALYRSAESGCVISTAAVRE
ncbi:Gfo/Idh/MocA family protein [Oricola thermophila]|uniref:Gfo/Idh/MocA family oxidoreductase n=1 Tax=Oricola thermophila TaxID=2742145 RepID=A0A6N1VEJ8_9HYPH|nr:Gfo/Idh/MocA family oxidoreductase [Oricola thermophila]QKV19108.1 Gfo/Idh/MocA family oxidoreductase [Oricola thermophila]